MRSEIRVGDRTRSVSDEQIFGVMITENCDIDDDEMIVLKYRQHQLLLSTASFFNIS